ncbi:TadE/TadG family type IV pilus assembly protein [Syntrophomonas palmitatica]|uniref:TadE/TadG family type IV pilus assembly protein n=1 Tax=Syntrophomonas palmitatica TaxID=402877 RepID=UPI0006D225F8|nr:TadE family protein [Syntrophomonas palmitatica]
MLKDQRGQTLVEFAIAIVILFLLTFGLIGTAYWGTASFLTQEIAHEVARQYAVSNNKERAIHMGQTYLDRWGYIFISPDDIQIAVSKELVGSNGNNIWKSTSTITVKPRIQKFFIYKMPTITKYSQATMEHYINNPELYAGGI